MTAMLDDTAADLRQIIADLQHKLDERTAELHENRERSALVSQAVAEGIYDWDIEHNALWVSPRLIEIFGLQGLSLSATDWNARVHPDDFEDYRAALRDCFKGTTARLACEYRIRLTNGEYRWVEDHGLPIRGVAESVVRLVGAVNDITERKEAEQALRESLDQQTATAEVLQVINSSPGDLAPVFDAMLDKATHLCEAEIGVLWTYSGEQMEASAILGAPPRYAEFLRQGPRPLSPTHQRLRRGERVIQIADVPAYEGYRSGLPLARALLDLGGVRTILMVPLRKDEAVLGAFAVYRKEIRPFSEKQIALLQNFAAQAVIAMENARLLGELRQRTGDLQELLEYQTATSDVLRVISRSTFDLKPVFATIVETATRLCDADDAIITNREGDAYRLVASFAASLEFDAVMQGRLFTVDRGSLTGRTALEGQVVHIHDIASDPGYTQTETLTLQKNRTMLGVPLLREGVVVGTINLGRTRVQDFTQRQIELVRTFADQAVIALENARLITETREALEQQTATAEVLQVINSSPGDLAPVFNAMLEKAMRLCEAVFGMLFLYDGKRFRAVVTEGVPEQAALLMRQPHPPPGFTMPILAGEPLLHIADVTALAGPEEAINRASVELGGVRTLLVVPLRKEGVLLGAIAVFRQEVRQFSVRQIALLQNFAAQAVIAMENARLITETREALDQQTATAEVLGVINSSPGNLAPVFDAMIEKAVRLCGAVHGVLRIFDGEVFHLAAVHGDPDVVARLKRLGPVEVSRAPTGDLMGRIARGDRLVHVADVRETDTYRDLPDARERLDVDGIRTWLAVALHKEETLLGVIVAYRREVRPFSDREISLLENFAAQAVIAMENARLLGELRARTDEIAGWNRELEARVAAQLAEIERTGKLRRFLAPQLADLIVAQGDESILESHRREIVVVFCDLRGFTGFAERAEPEEVMALLRDYHAAMGPIVARFEGTIDHYGGDGIMVFFNDPVPTPDPARRAIDMAVAMREAAQELLRNWRRHGHDIGFGVGISQGYATLGQIGFAERMDYTAIGTVTNLAARLCAEATDGQILVSARVAIAVEDSAALEEIGDLSLKGLSQAVAVYNVVAVGAPASAS